MFQFEDNSIIVCSSNYKKYILENIQAQNLCLNIKFFSKEEVIKGFNYTYDDEAMIELKKKYPDTSYSNIKEMLININNINEEDRALNNENINKLIECISYLKEKKLLSKDSLFEYYFKNKKVYVVGYSSLDEELKYYLPKDSIFLSIYTLFKEEVKPYRHLCYKFETFESEVKAVTNNICKLISECKDNKDEMLNNIFIYSPSEEYAHALGKALAIHGIPFEYNNDMILYDTKVFKKFLESLRVMTDEEYNNFNESFEKFFENYKEPIYVPIKNKLIKILNPLISLSLTRDELCEYVEYKAKSTSLQIKKFKYAVRIVSDYTYIKDDQYVFILGFNVATYPTILKDNDFINDECKKTLHRNTTIIKNKLARLNLIDFINNTKNVFITFSFHNGKQVNYESTLLPKDGFTSSIKSLEDLDKFIKAKKKEEDTYNDVLTPINVHTVPYIDDLKRYSDDYRNIEVVSFLDEEKSAKRRSLIPLKYKDMKFDNKFHTFEGAKHKGKLNLSYSKMNTFFECPYQYYLTSVLYLTEKKDTFYTKIGTAIHYELEKQINTKAKDPNIKFEEGKEQFFKDIIFKRYKDAIISHNKEIWDSTDLNRLEPEMVLNQDIIKDKLYFKGNSDIVYLNDETHLVACIDYKTSNFKYNPDLNKYGIYLQLPIYLYLLKNKTYHEQTRFVGAYIENLLNADNKNFLKMSGLTSKDANIVKMFDKSLMDPDNTSSTNITNLALLKSGNSFNARNKLLYDESQFNELLEIVDERIHYAYKQITDGQFPICSVQYGSNLSGCSYCPFKDICYHTYKDIVILKEEDDDNE